MFVEKFSLSVVDGDKRSDTSADDGRCGFRSQEKIHSYSRNCGESVYGNLRGEYWSIQSTLLSTTLATMVDCCVYLLIPIIFMKFFMTMKKVIVRVMTEDMVLGIERPSTLPFKITENVLMVIWRSVYRSKTIPSISHNTVKLSRLSYFPINVHERSGHRYQNIHHYSYNNGVIYIVYPRFPKEAVPRGMRGENIQKQSSRLFLVST